MTIIYATGQPRHFEFSTANNQEQLPSGAIVLAVADGNRLDEHLDERIFAQMSDEEYYQLQGIINETQRPEQTLH